MKRKVLSMIISIGVATVLGGCGAHSRVAPIARAAQPATAHATTHAAPKPAAQPLPRTEEPQRPFLTNLGAEGASFAPAGDQIVFAAGGIGHRTLYLAAPDGSQARPLGQGGYDDADPAWSPNGDEIAFVRHNGSRSSILRFSFSRRTVDSLLDSQETLQDPAWLPGGRGLVFISETGGKATLYRLDGGSPVSIWHGGHAAHPTVSADGMVVFESTEASGAVLVSVPLAGGPAKTLQVEGKRPRQPSFSPSGRSLAYVADDGLYVAQPDGTSARRLAVGSGLSAPGWNPRAPQIIVTAERGATQDLQAIALPAR